MAVNNKRIRLSCRELLIYVSRKKKRAGDRMYWDGWADKTMFMRKDGTFTKGNVYIDKGDEICVVVLVKCVISC